MIIMNQALSLKNIDQKREYVVQGCNLFLLFSTASQCPTSTFPKKRMTGFTLIEVLIAIVILSFGMLGLAGMQATGLKNNQSAFHRAQASQLAYDMADRIRANQIVGRNFASSTYVTGTATAHANCKNTTGCTPIQMAENDLAEWNTAITNALPMGQGTINAAGILYTLTINWDDNRDGVTDANDPNLTISFQLTP